MAGFVVNSYNENFKLAVQGCEYGISTILAIVGELIDPGPLH